MYSVPLTIVLCPAHRLQASVGLLSRFITKECSGCASIVLRGIAPPRTPNREIGLMERIGNMIARTKAKMPNRYSLKGIVDGAGRMVGAAVDVRGSSSSIIDSQSSSLSSSFSPNIEFWLRNRTVLAGLKCLNVVTVGAGLLAALIVSSSTSPTSVKMDRRRPSAG